jgi:apolipoprotein N-acyltransferase
MKTAGLAALSGTLLVLSFPKFGHWAVAWVALIPLLVALRPLSFRQALLAGILAGFVQHVGLLYWVTYVVVQYGQLPVALGVPVMMLLALYLSLYTGLFAGGIAFFRLRGIPAVVAAPLLWTVLEYAKSMLFTGFPWENLSHSQYLNLPLIQAADITGGYGISFLIVLVNAVLFSFIGTDSRERRMAFTAAAVATVLVALTAGYGFWRIGDITSRFEPIPRHTVALIQGNIDQSIKWEPSFQNETVRIYRDLSLQAAKASPRLIVWPETATPFMFQNRDGLREAVIDVAKSTGAYLLFGSPSYTRRDGELRFQNSAFVLSPAGETIGKYDKVHLVPYGEYVPLRPLFPFIEKLAVGVGDFLAGPGFEPVTAGGERVGVLICYEGIFPEIGRAWGRSNASLLVNITNDAWFGMTSAPFQHLSMTVFRAVENRLYVVRAANTGVSAIIDATGRITAQTNLFERTFLTGPVPMHRSGSFYTQYGDLFVFFCMIALLVIFYRPGGRMPWLKKFRKR